MHPLLPGKLNPPGCFTLGLPARPVGNIQQDGPDSQGHSCSFLPTKRLPVTQFLTPFYTLCFNVWRFLFCCWCCCYFFFFFLFFRFDLNLFSVYSILFHFSALVYCSISLWVNLSLSTVYLSISSHCVSIRYFCLRPVSF